MCAGKFQLQIDLPACSLSALLYKLVAITRNTKPLN